MGVFSRGIGLVLSIIWLFNLVRPERISFLSICFGLGINESPLDNIDISAVVNMWSDKLIILSLALCLVSFLSMVRLVL